MSNASAVWAAAAKREAEKEEMERCGENTETRTAALPDPSGVAWMEAGLWLDPAPQAAVMGHANSLRRCQQKGER